MNTKTQAEIKITQDLTLALPVVGYGKMITSPMIVDEWYLVPEEIDRSSIPKECIEIVEQWREAGIRIQGIVIAHDHQPDWWEEVATLPQPVPLLVPPPEETEQEAEEDTLDIEWDAIWETVGTVLKYMVIGALAITGIGVLLVLLLFAASAGCLVNDPVYIAVLADEYYEGTDKNLWIEVHRWRE